MKQANKHPQAKEIAEERAANAPTDEEIDAALKRVLEWFTRERETFGLLQQDVELAGGLKPKTLSNVERRNNAITFETFIRLCHANAKAPSDVARLMLDGLCGPSSTNRRRAFTARAVLAGEQVASDHAREFLDNSRNISAAVERPSEKLRGLKAKPKITKHNRSR